MFMLKLKLLVLISVLTLAGCAHEISIAPRGEKLPGHNNSKISKNVGYYISESDLTKSVETPGGGGDRISYAPYKDMDASLLSVLLTIYKDVFKLKAANEKSEIQKNNISYVFVPSIKTDSSSASYVTWPPTDFTVNLSMQAFDAGGNVVWQDTVTGKGHAEFDEFKQDFSLAARLATEEAYGKLKKAIENSSKLK